MKRSAALQRVGFKPRQIPLRSTAPAKSSAPLLRMRKCPVKKGGCGSMFQPAREKQIACLADGCAQAVGAWIAADKAKTARKEEAKLDRARRESMKGAPELKREAQDAFNRYVRFRDAGKGCLVCGVTLVLGGFGGGFDAGHIRSRSNADNLRFDERNVHGQCKPCNAAGATKDWQMREAADRRLGHEVAAELYADNRVIKWQRDQLREIRDTYRAKARQLEKQWKP